MFMIVSLLSIDLRFMGCKCPLKLCYLTKIAVMVAKVEIADITRAVFGLNVDDLIFAVFGST